MTQKRILLIVPTTTYRLDDFRKAARQLNVEVILASNRCPVLAKKWPDSHSLSVPLSKPNKACEKVIAALKNNPIHGIIAGDDTSTVLAAKIGQYWGLPANQPGAARKARNKLSFRHAIARAGLPTPRYGWAYIRQPADQYLPEVEFPCVLKPLMLSGSRGVIRANDPDEFTSAFQRIAMILRGREFLKNQCSSAYRKIIIESYIPGQEVAIEGLLTRGKLQILTIFDKPDPLEGPYFEETIYVTPSSLSAEQTRAISHTLTKACQGIGLFHGPIHAEARLNQQGVFLLELAPRTIGGLCSRALRFGAGISLEELVIRHALGEDLSQFQLAGDASGVMMIPIPKAGMLHDIQGIAEALSIPEVEDVKITIPQNHLVIPLPEGASYLGFIFARAKTANEVIHALRAAQQKLRFDIRPSLPVIEREQVQ